MTEISAKLIEWQESKLPDGCEYYEDIYGFHITENIAADGSSTFIVGWGEGDPEHFLTTDDAKEWCQDVINSFFRKYAVFPVMSNEKYDRLILEAEIQSDVDTYRKLIGEAREGLQTIYANNGEDAGIAKICNPLIDRLNLGM